MPQKRIKCLELLFDHLAWIEHQFSSGIRDSRKAGSLWGIIRGVEGVRKSIHQSWVAKGYGEGCYVEVLREMRKRFRRRRPALFKSDQWHFHQDNTPVHNFLLVTDYLAKMGIKTLPHPPYSPNLAPCDIWLFPKLRRCRYETIEECSTMGVGCQSRRFNCLFWRETRQRILGHEISPYPEVVRGGEWELTTRPSRHSW